MGNRDIVAIGTSAGGVQASCSLPRTCHAICPLRCFSRSTCPRPLPAQFAQNGEILRKARISIALPDRHLLVDGDRLSLGEGPRENKSRPAIDPMLRSAAVCCGSRTIGVGSHGHFGRWRFRAVCQAASITWFRIPRTRPFPKMPVRATAPNSITLSH
jgi:two-component system, chemotaxis family, protein-glutamate methylesterase/glutaminase